MTNHHQADESILHCISVLRMQEQSVYLKSTSDDARIDLDNRSDMAFWWLNLLEILEYPSEIAEIAMSYSDRYICTKAGFLLVRDRKAFRLLCVTCIYTAIKVHGYACVPPSSFSQLCQYEYTPEQIEEMESKLLRELEWRMNPPTGRSYLRYLVELLPVEDDKQVVLELADHQVLQAMQNEQWISKTLCTIAYCAFINASEMVGIDSTVLSSLQRILRVSLDMKCNQETEIRNDLQKLVLNSNDKLDKVYSSSSDKPIDLGSKAAEGSASASPRSALYQQL